MISTSQSQAGAFSCNIIPACIMHTVWICLIVGGKENFFQKKKHPLTPLDTLHDVTLFYTDEDPPFLTYSILSHQPRTCLNFLQTFLTFELAILNVVMRRRIRITAIASHSLKKSFHFKSLHLFSAQIY